MRREDARRVRREIADLAESGLDWVAFATQASRALARVVGFDRTCWHPVDPGTMLFTGSLAQNMDCDGAWLAHHEYVLDDVNKWVFLARSGYRAGSLSHATHGNLSLSARYRASQGMIGDELRGSFVVDGGYWGAVGFFRDPGATWFDDEEVRLLASLSSLMAEGFRRAVLNLAADEQDSDAAPGLVVFDEHGSVESVSAGAARWLAEFAEFPTATSPHQSRVLQAVAARVRHAPDELDGSELPARVRVQTLSGRWLVLDGIRLTGNGTGRAAVMIQPAPSHEVAPLVVEAYGLSERERQITLLCVSGMSTKEIAAALHIAPYTVQDHFKSIFQKTGARSRAELVGQIFLEHYVPRWREVESRPTGWLARDLAQPTPDRPVSPSV